MAAIDTPSLCSVWISFTSRLLSSVAAASAAGFCGIFHTTTAGY
jgi:hypothetical protein